MGVDLIIKAIPLILKKLPGVKFEILGDGEEKEYLKKLAKDLGVTNNVIFHGMINDRSKLEEILSDAALGVATFNTNIIDKKIKNADPGKIKDYMLMGMPVITTNALSYSNQITERKCGVVISYKPEELSVAIIKLLKNKKLLKEYRKNALKFVRSFDWDHILKPNINRVLREFLVS